MNRKSSIYIIPTILILLLLLFAAESKAQYFDYNTGTDSTATDDTNEEENTDDEEEGGDGFSMDTELSFGFKTGGSFSSFTHNKRAFTLPKNGLYIGGYFQNKITDFMSFALEIAYAQEGANELDPSYIYFGKDITIANSTKIASNVTLHNFEMPVMLNFYHPEFEEVQPYFSLGASFDWVGAAIARDRVTVGGSSYSNVLLNYEKENVTSSFKRFNPCLMLGTGINFNADDISYSLNVRYKWGMNRINNLATLNLNNFYKYDFSYNALMVTLGIGFNL